MKRLALLLIPAVFLLSAATGEPPHVLRARIRHSPVSFDWNLAVASVDGVVLKNVMEGLTQPGPDRELVPVLAESWESKSKDTVFAFKLRDSIFWSDGKPLKAQQFVDGWIRVLSPEVGSGNASLLFDVVGAEEFHRGKIKDPAKVGAKAVDDKTVEVRLKRPVPHWPWLTSFWPLFPVRLDQIRELGSSWSKPSNMVCLGPYVLADYIKDKAIILKRNKKYFGTRGNLDGIRIEIVKEDPEAIQAYLEKKLDYLPKVSSFSVSAMSGRKDLYPYPSPRTFFMAFNPKSGPFSSRALRKSVALTAGMENRPKILKHYYPARSLLPPGFKGHSLDVGLMPSDEEAMDELVRSGFQRRKMGIRITTLDYEDTRNVTAYVKSRIETVLKIPVEAVVLSQKEFGERVLSNGDFEMAVLATLVPYPHHHHYFDLFRTKSDRNFTGWSNHEFDLLTGGKATRKKLMEAQKILQEREIIAVPLLYDGNWGLVSPSVKGFEPDQFTRFFFKRLSLK